ncbi:MAG: CYTH domain-containing protein [Muribaculaceae bacterium]|nr:CYTH domain-containing protein [Muribaculaceae bacterium]
MATEIEHKYLVKNKSYRKLAIRSHNITQGYLSKQSGQTVRIRIRDEEAFITIKGPSKKDVRPEFEYPIPLNDAQQILTLCLDEPIVKTRFIVIDNGNTWEIDEFHGALEGLVIAEIELPSADYNYPLPDFIGKNVTDDKRYYNSNLSTLEALKH